MNAHVDTTAREHSAEVRARRSESLLEQRVRDLAREGKSITPAFLTRPRKVRVGWGEKSKD